MLRVALAAGIAAVAVLLFSRRRKVSRQFTPRPRSENRGPRRSNSRLLGRPDARGDRFACFLSHFKIQCASEARLLQAELEAALGRRCFLDSDDLKDLRELTEHVRKSEVLVLIQSSGVLKRPWCLLELVTAIDAGIPIVGVALSSGPYVYDFRAAAEFLLALGEPGLLDHDAAVLLEGQGVALDDAARKLSSVIPSMVSIAFDPFASRTVLAATVFDVVEAMNQALSKPPMQLMSAEEWSRTKAKAASALHGKAATPSAQVLSSMGNRAKCLAILPPEVPNLPETAVSRPEIAALKQLVLEAGGGLAATVTARTPGTAAAGSRTAAAAGMGGVGKTMTAAALARDEEVLRRAPPPRRRAHVCRVRDPQHRRWSRGAAGVGVAQSARTGGVWLPRVARPREPRAQRALPRNRRRLRSWERQVATAQLESGATLAAAAAFPGGEPWVWPGGEHWVWLDHHSLERAYRAADFALRGGGAAARLCQSGPDLHWQHTGGTR